MVEAEYRLVWRRLGINHLRLVMGTSIGRMHTWLWESNIRNSWTRSCRSPACHAISGRNRVWRAPSSMRFATTRHIAGRRLLDTATRFRTARDPVPDTSNPVLWQRELSTLALDDSRLDEAMTSALKTADANDVLYRIEASYDYDPGPGLEKIPHPCER